MTVQSLLFKLSTDIVFIDIFETYEGIHNRYYRGSKEEGYNLIGKIPEHLLYESVILFNFNQEGVLTIYV